MTHNEHKHTTIYEITEDSSVFSGETGLELGLHNNNNDNDNKTGLASHVYCEKLTLKLWTHRTVKNPFTVEQSPSE